MKSFIRAIVASPKQTHYDPELDLVLDLAYITDKLIVSSGPVNHYLKLVCRYPADHFLRFLDKNHGRDHWHLWNFKLESQEYNSHDFDGKVSYFRFPDHQAPTLEIMYHSCVDIHRFLSLSTENVALLHCRAGKGRSGTICCAYLMYLAVKKQKPVLVLDVIEIFTKKRMKPFAGYGVSIQSQRRYLYYWDQFLRSSRAEQEEALGNHEVTLTTIMIFGVSSVDQFLKKNFTIDAYDTDPDTFNVRNIVPIWTLDKHCVIDRGSDYIVLHPNVRTTKKDLRLTFKSVTYCWFNAFYESRFCAFWEDFDGIHGSQLRGSKEFDRIVVKMVTFIS